MFYKTIISAATLAENLHLPNWLILDCREQFFYGKQSYSEFIESHIPNACYCSFSENYLPNLESKNSIFCQLNSHQQIVSDYITENGFDLSAQIVIYDNDCSSFTNAVWLQLRSLGYQNVAVLQGGLENWIKQGFSVTTNDTHVSNPSA